MKRGIADPIGIGDAAGMLVMLFPPRSRSGQFAAHHRSDAARADLALQPPRLSMSPTEESHQRKSGVFARAMWMSAIKLVQAFTKEEEAHPGSWVRREACGYMRYKWQNALYSGNGQSG